MNRKQKVIGAAVVAVVLIVGGSLWAYSATRGRDAETASQPQGTGHGKALFAEVHERGDHLPTEEQLKAAKEKVEALQPGDRREFGHEMMKMHKEKIAKFFTLSKEEQEAALDRDIALMEMMGKMGGMGFGGPRGPRPEGGAPPAGTPREAGASPAPGANGPSGGGPGGTNPEARVKFRKDMLDRTTPEERAQMYQYRKMIQDRRQEKASGSAPMPPR